MANKQFNAVDGYSVGNATIVIDANGNVSANALTVAATTNVTGNLTSGNANLGNLVVANYFQGDGGLLTNIAATSGSYIANGNSNVNIPSANGNVNISATGNANIVVVTGIGANINGTLFVSGNANVGNLQTSAITSNGNISLTGSNVDLGNVSNLHISGGSANYFLKTDGTGNLSWDQVTSGGSVPIATTPPSMPSAGDMWWNSENGTLFIYYNDGNSSQWVNSSPGFPGPAGNAGPPGPAGNGVVTGGTTGQVLAKKTNADYDTEWVTISTSAIANGNSTVSIPSSNGNVNITAVGNTTLVVTGTGANITGTLGVSGNATFDSGTLFVDSTNNRVGIGTSSPNSKLHVSGGATPLVSRGGAATTTFIENANNTSYLELAANATSTTGILFARGNATGDYGLITYINASDNMLFYTAATEKMLLDRNGNLGIGTSSPGHTLDIQSNDTTAGLGYGVRIRSNATAAAAAVQFTDSSATTQNGLISVSDTGTLTLQADGSASYLAFRTNGVERLRISNAGAITSSDLADAVGYKGIPQNSQSSDYTIALADIGKHISISSGNVILPANSTTSFPIGSTIVVFNNNASTTRQIQLATDTLRLAGTTSTGNRTLAVYGLATVVKVDNTVWVVSGSVT